MPTLLIAPLTPGALDCARLLALADDRAWQRQVYRHPKPVVDPRLDRMVYDPSYKLLGIAQLRYTHTLPDVPPDLAGPLHIAITHTILTHEASPHAIHAHLTGLHTLKLGVTRLFEPLHDAGLATSPHISPTPKLGWRLAAGAIIRAHVAHTLWLEWPI